MGQKFEYCASIVCVWIPEGLDIVMRSASPIVSHLSQPYFHLYICKTISSFFTFFFKFANPYFLFFYFLCPTPNTYLQFRIYTKSRCDKKCPFPQFLISFICFEIIILEFLQHDDWGQIDQIFSASYLGKHCQMLKIDIYPSYVPELILKNILSTVSRTFLEKLHKIFIFSAPLQFCEQLISFIGINRWLNKLS